MEQDLRGAQMSWVPAYKCQRGYIAGNAFCDFPFAQHANALYERLNGEITPIERKTRDLISVSAVLGWINGANDGP